MKEKTSSFIFVKLIQDNPCFSTPILTRDKYFRVEFIKHRGVLQRLIFKELLIEVLNF